MKAIAFTAPGPPDVLEVMDLPDPVPGPGEVLVRVQAAAVNPTDTVLRTSPADEPGPRVPGMDAAGVVEAVGSTGDAGLEVGDAVMAVVVPDGSHGAYAELVSVPVASVARIPEGASVIESSTLPMNGLTARLALDTLDLAPGSTIAVTGAAGALGGYCVQLASTDGLTVVADAKEGDDEELVEALGADHVLPRGPGFADAVLEVAPEGVDGVVDAAVQTDEVVPAARDGATVITIRGDEGERDRGVSLVPILVVDYHRRQDLLEELRQEVEAGVVSLRVADTLPAERAAEAHRRLEAGGVRGRLVLEL